MDSIEIPGDPVAPAPVIPSRPAPRVWKFWGTAAWGLFIFAAMFIGQIAVVAWFLVQQEGPMDRAAVLRVAGNGLVISLSVILELPTVLAALWLAIRLSRTPFADYLALRWTSWTNALIGVASFLALVLGWEALSQVIGHTMFARLHGRCVEIGPCGRCVMAARNRICRRRTDVRRIAGARFSLPRLVGNGAAARRRHPAVVSDMDGDASTIRPGLVSVPRGVLDRPVARLSPLSQQLDLADDHSARPQQSGRGGADDVAGGAGRRAGHEWGGRGPALSQGEGAVSK